jgi:MYXO-CTERM domain-containing protein
MASLTGAERLVLVISALGGESHDADNPGCTVTHGFTYDLRTEDLETMPIPDTMTPGGLEAGTSALFTVQGMGFMPGLTAALVDAPADVFVSVITVVDPNTLTLEISTFATAAAATYDLRITNPNGQQGTLSAALQIVPPPAPEGGGGCGCSATGPGHAGGGASLLLVLLIWLLVDWRRPRRPLRGRPR